MPLINCAFDVAFEVIGNYEDSTKIPYEVIVEAMKQRAISLAEHPEYDAFDCYDEFEMDDENDRFTNKYKHEENSTDDEQCND